MILSFRDMIKEYFYLRFLKLPTPHMLARVTIVDWEPEILNDNNILMQTSFNWKKYFQTIFCKKDQRILLFSKTFVSVWPPSSPETGARNIRVGPIIKFWNFCFLTAADISEELFHRSGNFAASQLCCMEIWNMLKINHFMALSMPEKCRACLTIKGEK